jgi:hypothetical protein
MDDQLLKQGNQQAGRSSRWLLLIPFLVALAIHSPGLGHGFVGDDDILILNNTQITSPISLRELLLTDWFNRNQGEGGIGYYRPLIKASFRATYALAGANPLPYHAVNVLFHGVTALALALVLRRFTSPRAAAVGASLFAAHPSTVEAVAIVTSRSDVFAGAFVLLSLAAFLRWRESSHRGWLAAALATSLLAYGSKESALFLPALLAVSARVKGEPPRVVLRAVAPFLVVLAGFLLVRTQAAHTVPLPNTLAELPVAVRGLAVLEVVGQYLAPLLLGRSVLFYPRVPEGPLSLGVLLGLAVVLAGVVALVRSRLRSPVSLALVLGGLSLAPVLAIWLLHVPMWRDELPMADRWLYIPCAALGMLVALVLDRLSPRAGLLGGSALVAAFASLTALHTPHFATRDTLMDYFVEECQGRDLASLSPSDRVMFHTAQASALKREGRLAEALEHARAAVGEAEWLPEGWQHVGMLELELGHPEKASAALERLLSPEFESAPAAWRQRRDYSNDSMERMNRPPLYALLAESYAAQGKWEQAARAMQQAARMSGDGGLVAIYRSHEANAWERAGRIVEARAAWDEVLRLEPAHPDAARQRARLDAVAQPVP